MTSSAVAQGWATGFPLEPVTPAALDQNRLVLVAGAARMSGARAEALLAVNTGEDARRDSAGLGAVTDLGLLNLLMGLPLGVPVGVEPHLVSALTRLPGLVEVSGGPERRVTRLAEPPVLVHAAVVSGRGWRPLLRRASAFEGVCQRIVVLDAEPRDLTARLWEADLLGIGVWCRAPGGSVSEVLAPAVFVPSYFKPARWRFQENAYAAYLHQAEAPGNSHDSANSTTGQVSARNRPEWSPGPTGRRSRTAAATSDPQQESFPLH